MTFLIDANIAVPILNRNLEIAAKLRQIADDEIGVPAIVIAELTWGANKSAFPARNLRSIDVLAARFEIVPFNLSAAYHYGRLRADLFKMGKSIGPNDMLIAATAMAHNATLVTRNIREFSRVPGLRCVEW